MTQDFVLDEVKEAFKDTPADLIQTILSEEQEANLREAFAEDIEPPISEALGPGRGRAYGRALAAPMPGGDWRLARPIAPSRPPLVAAVASRSTDTSPLVEVGPGRVGLAAARPGPGESSEGDGVYGFSDDGASGRR